MSLSTRYLMTSVREPQGCRSVGDYRYPRYEVWPKPHPGDVLPAQALSILSCTAELLNASRTPCMPNHHRCYRHIPCCISSLSLAQREGVSNDRMIVTYARSASLRGDSPPSRHAVTMPSASPDKSRLRNAAINPSNTTRENLLVGGVVVSSGMFCIQSGRSRP
jgi:hypothetical protein